MTDTQALIARLEAATGPSFTLEQEIFRAVNPNATKLSVPNNYTSSIDAALTLVPEGWLWRIMPSDFNGWLAEVWTDDTLDGEFGARAPTPALAIVIAALRAKGGE